MCAKVLFGLVLFHNAVKPYLNIFFGIAKNYEKRQRINFCYLFSKHNKPKEIEEQFFAESIVKIL